ncbi:hypothetical protein J5X84_06135 [Streptosporangiaceae bacterium NEAU-GS5]|nr:hypothetical protein [Streptosporangiaceae bacterium NEAU-GS5]
MIHLISFYADLAIGLVLAFLLLSLLVSGINEGVVRILSIRSRFLWAYLRDTLDGGEVVTKIPGYLKALEKGLRKMGAIGRRLLAALTDILPPPDLIRSRLPATIIGVFAKLPFGKDPRPDFASAPAPIDSPPLAPGPDAPVAAAVTEAAAVAADETVADPGHGPEMADPGEVASLGIVPPSEGKSMSELLHERLQEIDHTKRGKTSIATIPPNRFAVALMEIASERGGVANLVSDLSELQSPLYRPIKAVWDRSALDIDAFRKGVEDWFDGEMERLTLLYRRYVRWVIAVVGLLLTLGFAMDSLEYGKTLLNDQAYRSQVAAFGAQGAQALEPLTKQCAAGEDPYTCVTDVLSTPAFVKVFAYAPVSVTVAPGGSPKWRMDWGGWWDRVRSPGHWPGFLITFFALLFGAPFWWDILRRVTGIRSRVAKTQ